MDCIDGPSHYGTPLFSLLPPLSVPILRLSKGKAAPGTKTKGKGGPSKKSVPAASSLPVSTTANVAAAASVADSKSDEPTVPEHPPSFETQEMSVDELFEGEDDDDNDDDDVEIMETQTQQFL